MVIAATGLIMLPVHMASYRERGVLRRFAAAGFPRWSFAIAQLVMGLAMIVLAAALLLGVAALVYGIPPVGQWWRVVVGFVFGSVGFISLGVLLGSLLPSARSAQAVGLLLFFPSFLLGAGGPPPQVMGSALRQVAEVLPLTLVTDAIRKPWLGLGNATVETGRGDRPGHCRRVRRRRATPGRAITDDEAIDNEATTTKRPNEATDHDGHS